MVARPHGLQTKITILRVWNSAVYNNEAALDADLSRAVNEGAFTLFAVDRELSERLGTGRL